MTIKECNRAIFAVVQNRSAIIANMVNTGNLPEAVLGLLPDEQDQGAFIDAAVELKKWYDDTPSPKPSTKGCFGEFAQMIQAYLDTRYAPED